MKLLALVLLRFMPGSEAYATAIWQESLEAKIDPLLTAAIIYSESRFKKRACHNGSHGLMQVQLRPRDCKRTLAAAEAAGLYTARGNLKRGLKLAAWWRRWWQKHHADEGYHWLLHFNQGFGKVCPWPYYVCDKEQLIPVTTGKVGQYAKKVLRVYRQLQRIRESLAGEHVACAWDASESALAPVAMAR